LTLLRLRLSDSAMSIEQRILWPFLLLALLASCARADPGWYPNHAVQLVAAWDPSQCFTLTTTYDRVRWYGQSSCEQEIVLGGNSLPPPRSFQSLRVGVNCDSSLGWSNTNYPNMRVMLGSYSGSIGSPPPAVWIPNWSMSANMAYANAADHLAELNAFIPTSADTPAHPEQNRVYLIFKNTNSVGLSYEHGPYNLWAGNMAQVDDIFDSFGYMVPLPPPFPDVVPIPVSSFISDPKLEPYFAFHMRTHPRRCHVGYYLDWASWSCQKCPKGTYQPVEGVYASKMASTGSCLPCDPGTFTDAEGTELSCSTCTTSLLPCERCDPQSGNPEVDRSKNQCRVPDPNNLTARMCVENGTSPAYDPYGCSVCDTNRSWEELSPSDPSIGIDDHTSQYAPLRQPLCQVQTTPLCLDRGLIVSESKPKHDGAADECPSGCTKCANQTVGCQSLGPYDCRIGATNCGCTIPDATGGNTCLPYDQFDTRPLSPKLTPLVNGSSVKSSCFVSSRGAQSSDDEPRCTGNWVVANEFSNQPDTACRGYVGSEYCTHGGLCHQSTDGSCPVTVNTDIQPWPLCADPDRIQCNGLTNTSGLTPRPRGYVCVPRNTSQVCSIDLSCT